MSIRTAQPASAGSSRDPFTPDCPGREIFNHITSRWGLLILMALGSEPMRFHVLRDRIGGVSEKMLSQNLKTLTRDGLITRIVEPTIPPKVSYQLTSIGSELSEHLHGLLRWMGRRVPDVLQAQERYDGQEARGEKTRKAL